MKLENKHAVEMHDGITRVGIHCIVLHVERILNEGKVIERLDVGFLGCSPMPVLEAEEEEIEQFSGKLHEQHHEQYHEPHHAANFCGATIISLVINLLGHCKHSVDVLLLAFF